MPVVEGNNQRASDEYRRRICRAIDFINANLANNPSMAEIARAAAFSCFHFQRLFCAVVGESVAQFTRRVRLETAARHLLFRPQADVTGIAISLGFSSSQNFAKAFRKHFGALPTEYREQHRGSSPAGAGTESLELHAGVTFGTWPVRLEAAVTVRCLSAVRVVYQRHFGSYRDPGVQAAFDRIVRWAKPCGLDVFDQYRGIPWDDADITSGDRCRFDACLIVPEDARLDAGVNWQTIPAGRYAAFATEVVDNDFELPWTRLMRDWLPPSGFQPADGPRFEVYHTDGSRDPGGHWQIEICLPVEPLH